MYRDFQKVMSGNRTIQLQEDNTPAANNIVLNP